MEVTEEVPALSQRLLTPGPLPQKAAEDAVHIAVAVVNGLDYLVTWNCKHSANAKMRDRIDRVLQSHRHVPAGHHLYARRALGGVTPCGKTRS